MRTRQLRTMMVVLATCAILSAPAGAIPAVVLTNTGQVAEGSLGGLSSILRLIRPDERGLVGPDGQFDVPLSAIRQITLDFPRIIVETATRTLIGPFSAFLGIPETVTLDRAGSGAFELATSSLRAIALNGASLRPVPREWMGAEFLTEPSVLGASVGSALASAACEDCSIASPSDETAADGDRPIWSLTPTLLPEGGDGEIPWWVGLLGVAAVVGVLFLLSSSGGPSS